MDEEEFLTLLRRFRVVRPRDHKGPELKPASGSSSFDDGGAARRQRLLENVSAGSTMVVKGSSKQPDFFDALHDVLRKQVDRATARTVQDAIGRHHRELVASLGMAELNELAANLQ